MCAAKPVLCRFYADEGLEPRVLCMQGRHSANRTISPTSRQILEETIVWMGEIVGLQTQLKHITKLDCIKALKHLFIRHFYFIITRSSQVYEANILSSVKETIPEIK